MRIIIFFLLPIIGIWFLTADAAKNEKELTPDDFQAAGGLSPNELDAWLDEGGEDPILSAGKFEGDIVFPEGLDILNYVDDVILGDKTAKLPERKASGRKGIRNNAIRGLHKKWPSAKIPYTISSAFSAYDRSVIAAAIAAYDTNTCVRWIPRTNQRDYVYIMRGGGCYSHVGKSGGKQDLSLGNNCVHKGIVVHEMMHAAGFFHEQSRADRDSYVTIQWNNIIASTKYNFNKYTLSQIDHLGTKYDYGSVMHYGGTAFARSWGLKTIVPKKAGITLGQRRGLSANDIVKLNKFYSCKTTGGGKVTPKPGGKVTTPRPVVSCRDNSPHCSYWKRHGYCTRNPAYMNTGCPKSCGKCGGGGGSSNCRDTGAYCADWTRKGECSRNPAYMQVSCRRSCGLCVSNSEGGGGRGGGSSNCKDVGAHCADWKRKGECEKNPAFMRGGCKKSCGFCGSNSPSGGSGSSNCRDTGVHCEDWEKKGECTKNAAYMRTSCKRSCGFC